MQEKMKRILRVQLATDYTEQSNELFLLVVKEVFERVTKISMSREGDRGKLEFEIQTDGDIDFLKKVALEVYDLTEDDNEAVKFELEAIPIEDAPVATTEVVPAEMETPKETLNSEETETPDEATASAEDAIEVTDETAEASTEEPATSAAENNMERGTTETEHDNIAEPTDETTQEQPQALTREEVIERAKALHTNSVKELSDMLLSCLGFPSTRQADLYAILKKANNLATDGKNITWENLKDEGLPTSLTYKKSVLDPIRKKLGEKTRLIPFVKSMIACINPNAQEKEDVKQEVPTLPETREGHTLAEGQDTLTFENVISRGLYVNNYAILGEEGAEFFKNLLSIRLNTERYDLNTRVARLYNYIYNYVLNIKKISDNQDKMSSEFIAYSIENNVLPSATMEEDYQYFAAEELKGDLRADGLMTLFLKTGHVVSIFMKEVFNLEMGLPRFISAIRPVFFA